MTETRPSCKDRHHAQSPATRHGQASWNHPDVRTATHYMLRTMAANAQVISVMRAVRPG